MNSREDALKFLENYECQDEVDSEWKEIVNPKTNETIKTCLTFREAINILKKKTGNNSFVKKIVEAADNYGEDRLFPSYRFWLYKLAIEGVQPERKIKLKEGICDELLNLFNNAGLKYPLFQWKTIDENGEYTGKVKLFPDANRQYIVVLCGHFFYGKIEKDDHFHPSSYCKDSNDVVAQLLVLSLDVLAFLRKFGKDTGMCCVCGRLLTDEISVANGIGPICAERYGW